ncbi:hypothetical protein [Nocardia sp. N2S4-5]|uniref:hypothetical protein n=1 Tax=Nocardia sp. N2S4-5 TaxID=3351565 RepID=UPI0037CD14F3
MPDVSETMTEIVDTLRAQGIRANLDPAKLNPPCAWVQPTQIEHTLLGGGVVLTVAVWLIATDRPPDITHAALSALLSRALVVLEPTEPTVINEAITLTQSGQPLPAYRITTTREIC